eukprot:TRINITY_DN5423_c0_g1_i1.p2 TRINITY_DN5423_c0_g1~~TRINITY_DN5423_c0_g1_i1.p2  ORF type:complete len:118 (+),score=16.03 TRINITY_DN5423_c0_g1_i1:438-791(+)
MRERELFGGTVDRIYEAVTIGDPGRRKAKLTMSKSISLTNQGWGRYRDRFKKSLRRRQTYIAQLLMDADDYANQEMMRDILYDRDGRFYTKKQRQRSAIPAALEDCSETSSIILEVT